MSDQIRVTSGGAARSALLVTGPTDASGNAPGTSANPTTTQAAALPPAIDRSGSITAAGVAQTVAPSNPARRGLDFQNTSDTEMRLTESDVPASATNGFQVPAGGSFRARTNRLISVFCATAGKTFAATEWGGDLASVPVPTAFSSRWSPPMAFTRSVSGVYATDSVGIPMVPSAPTRTIYVHPQLGSNTNSGANSADVTVGSTGPLKDVSAALAKATDGDTVILCDATADYFWQGTTGWANAAPAGNVYLVNRSTYRLGLASGSIVTGWTAHATLPNVYQRTIAASSVGSITDVTTLAPPVASAFPLPSVKTPYLGYTRLAGTDPSVLTPGTFLHDGTNVYAMASDQRNLAVSTGLFLGNTTNNVRPGSNTGQITYIDGFDCIGGAQTVKALTTDATQTPILVMRNCTIQGSANAVGSTSNNGLNIVGPYAVYLYRCLAAYNGADGFNYHDFTANGGGVSSSPKWFENECVAYANGVTGSTNSSDNASTSHEYSTGIRLNCVYPNSDDNVAGDGNAGVCMNWNMGIKVGNPLKPGASLVCAAQSFGSYWWDGCSLVNTGGRYQYFAGTSCQAFFRNMPIPTYDPAGGGTVAAY